MRRVIIVAAFAAACSGSNGKDGQNGQNGKTTLIRVDPVAPGASCPAGGFAINSGLDGNGNGVLDPAEVTTTSTVCNGQDGLATLLTSTTEPPGANCTYGGVKLQSGVDANRDGALQAGEVTSTSYVCNGANGGLNGHDFLISITQEPAGANCANGGLRVQGGLDANGDGTLQPAEVTSTSYVCNGANGANGQNGLSTLFTSAPEPAGANCPAGGTAIMSGLDLNRDGVLEPAEVTSTSFVCDGTPGLNALVSTAVEPPGANCANGGIVVRTGADTNGDGLLQPGEVTGTRYVCNGAPGAQGLPGAVSLVRQVDEPAGANCAFGGKAILSGVDTNGNGVLDPSEVTATSYVCNGAPGAPGTNGLNSAFLVTAEPPGANCPTGGEKIQTGLDSNRNGVLDPSEVSATAYVCNGGSRLYAASNAPLGGVCARGGVRIDAGIDANGDGILQPSEIQPSLTQYVCNLYLVTASEGYQSACALVSDGTVRCWGDNSLGQLGDSTLPTELAPVPVPGVTGATAIAVGAFHACALLTNGTAKCWGDNEAGQLGNGNTTPQTAPVVVSGLSGAVDLAAGGLHSCAVISGGTARCWGANDVGQLGDGTTVARTTPVAVSGLTGVAALTGGFGHTCARLSGGGVRCWGDNTFGELGDGTGANSSVPVTVTGLSGAADVSAGGYHTCAAIDDGSAWCWGYNSNGQLGDGSPAGQSLVPTPVALTTGVSRVSGGLAHTCARAVDGTAWCWGWNGNGQLGDGTLLDESTPVAVTGLGGAVGITAGGTSSCAVFSDGSARCWGANGLGQLGDGTTSDGTSPVGVVFTQAP